MSKRKGLDDFPPSVLPIDAGQAYEEMMGDIPDFTREQWVWLQKKTHELEKTYVPTHSLISGL